MYDPLNNQNEQNLNRSEQVSGNANTPQSSDTGYSAAYTGSTNPSDTSAGYSSGETANAENNQTTQETPKTYYNPGYGGYSQQSWGGGNTTSGGTVWEGSSYHYSAGAPQAGQAPQGGKPKKPKKERKHNHLGLKIVACVLACLLISGGSIAGFAALINSGYISMGASSSDDNITINKLIQDTDNTNASTNTTGKLTVQEAANKVIPSVVSVLNYQKVNQQSYLGGGFYRDGSDQGDENNTAEEQESSEGSGIIATQDGYIITNAHVVDGADSLYVVLYDGTKYAAELVGSDTVTDLAVLKIDATGLTAAEFGSSDDLQIGDQVLAIGNPGGLGSSTTVGYISALNRAITSEDGYTMNCIQTDAAINPGNSGGALVNLYGQVVGINSSKIAATEYEGLGFAIPMDTAQSVINSLKEYGYVKDRAVLGITGQYVDSYTARFYGLQPGMYVAEISNPSVSEAGITKGCVITKIDDTNVDSQTAITAYLVNKKPGDKVTLTVYNGLEGREFTAEVEVIESSNE